MRDYSYSRNGILSSNGKENYFSRTHRPIYLRKIFLFYRPTDPTCFSRRSVEQLIKLPSPKLKVRYNTPTHGKSNS